MSRTSRRRACELFHAAHDADAVGGGGGDAEAARPFSEGAGHPSSGRTGERGEDDATSDVFNAVAVTVSGANAAEYDMQWPLAAKSRPVRARCRARSVCEGREDPAELREGSHAAYEAEDDASREGADAKGAAREAEDDARGGGRGGGGGGGGGRGRGAVVSAELAAAAAAGTAVLSTAGRLQRARAVLLPLVAVQTQQLPQQPAFWVAGKRWGGGPVGGGRNGIVSAL